SRSRLQPLSFLVTLFVVTFAVVAPAAGVAGFALAAPEAAGFAGVALKSLPPEPVLSPPPPQPMSSASVATNDPNAAFEFVTNRPLSRDSTKHRAKNFVRSICMRSSSKLHAPLPPEEHMSDRGGPARASEVWLRKRTAGHVAAAHNMPANGPFA